MDKQPPMNREERSWVLYDVGNSAFVLVMVTAIMPIYFKQLASPVLDPAASTAAWGYANSTASFILAILAPILGALADYPGKKRRFFLVFLGIGVTFCLLLPLIGQSNWLFCLLLFVLARVGWAGANLFYDAFLPDVTSPQRMDLISARGYGYGYIGSVVPFVIIIGLLTAAGMKQGLPETATRLSFVLVALWWLALSVPAILHLRQRHSLSAVAAPVREGFSRVVRTLRSLSSHRQVFFFLAAYFFYIDGVSTIISMSTAYGTDLGFGPTMLIIMLLFIQVVAFPCALVFGHLAGRFTSRALLLLGIAIYAVATLLAALLPDIGNLTAKTVLFWVIAFLVASAMGGIQALSRSLYARLIPAQVSGEFFGFYNILGKFAAIGGPLLMATVTTITGHSRWGVLAVLVLFLIGGGLLLLVKEPPGEV